MQMASSEFMKAFRQTEKLFDWPTAPPSTFARAVRARAANRSVRAAPRPSPRRAPRAAEASPLASALPVIFASPDAKALWRIGPAGRIRIRPIAARTGRSRPAAWTPIYLRAWPPPITRFGCSAAGASFCAPPTGCNGGRSRTRHLFHRAFHRVWHRVTGGYAARVDPHCSRRQVARHGHRDGFAKILDFQWRGHLGGRTLASAAGDCLACC